MLVSHNGHVVWKLNRDDERYNLGAKCKEK